MVTKGDRRRQRILDAVAELLETETFEEISIAEITRRADVTRPGFYFYFPTKGAAVASLMEGLFGEFMDAAGVWYEHREADQETGLRAGMEATVDLWRKHAVVMHGMVQAAAAEKEAREIWQRWIAAFTARAVPTIAADLGSTRTSPRAEEIATFLVDATFAAMQRDVRALVEEGTGMPRLVDSIVHVWVRTLYSR
ncbi:MAG: TetR/AcrR family transcriptional regulator [Marmoricola sp.]